MLVKEAQQLVGSAVVAIEVQMDAVTVEIRAGVIRLLERRIEIEAWDGVCQPALQRTRASVAALPLAPAAEPPCRQTMGAGY